jgi:hypothetical protein
VALFQRGDPLTRSSKRPAAGLALSICLFLPLHPARTARGQETWKSAHDSVTSLLREYRRFEGDRFDEDAYRPLVSRLEKALEVALSSATSGPPAVERVRAVLPLVEEWAPEAHHLVYGVFSKAIGAAIRKLEAEEMGAFDAYTRELWSAKTRKEAEKTTLQRMIVATSIAAMVGTPERREALVELTHHLLERETAWIQPVSRRPLPISRAVKALGTQPETATIYPVLDAVEAIYEAFSDGEASALLEPFVTSLIDLIEKVEVRVAGRKSGEVLAADDDRSTSQFRVWFRAIDLLQKWTGERLYVWAADWRKFWELYSGPGRAQSRFDFAAAKGGATASGRTVVVATEDAFFGIEARTSKFLIVLDVSTSMIRNPQNVDRFTPLKKEAIRFIRSLKPGVHYNILPFSTTCEIQDSLTRSHELRPKLLPRGQIDEDVRQWIENLRTEAFTRVDLAFRAAFNAPEGDGGRRGRSSGFKPRFNEIYFITDGSPTNERKELMTSDERLDLLSMIRALNARHRVTIHTVGFPRMDHSFIRQLAVEHGGRTVVVKD